MWYHAKHVSYTVQFLNPQPKLAWDACNRNSVCQGTGVMTKHHHHLSRSKWYLPPVFCDNTMTAWWDTRCVPSRYNYTLHILHKSIGYNSQYEVLHSQFRWGEMTSLHHCLHEKHKYISLANRSKMFSWQQTPSWKISCRVVMRLMFASMMLESFPHHR